LLAKQSSLNNGDEQGMSMRSTVRNALMLAAVAAVWPMQAHAASYVFDFMGPGVSGRLNLTYEPNPNVGPLPQTAPNLVDPVGSFVITGITGTYSDTALGISNAAVTGIVPLNRVSPEPTNLLAPNSFSLLPVSNGVASPGGLSLGLHYDNLFYPAGSPQTASDYPFSGGVFDIYGMAFNISGGNSVNFWSNGTVPGAGLDYGVAVTNGVDVLNYTAGVSIAAVPEPATWAMFIGGFGLIGGAMRRRRKVSVSFA
jgi:hypothetical protein